MTDRRTEVNWTAKAPTLIVGAVALLLGLLATARGRWIVAFLLIGLGVAFIGYSMTIKEWCYVHQHGWKGANWGETGFGGSIGECAKYKGWFSF